MSTLARIIAGPDRAPTLVLLHGITGSAMSLAGAIDHWAGRGLRVVAVDARGHGLSPRWSPEQIERAGEVLVEDLVEVLEGLAAGKAAGPAGRSAPPGAGPVVIGHSMGAATAMVAAGRRPDLMAGVVLEDPALYGTRSPEELVARGAARERARAAEAADPAGSLARSTAPPTEILPDVWAAQRTDSALLRSGVVCPEVPWRQAVEEMGVPALLVTGDGRGARVGPQGAEVMAGLNPRLEGVVIPGAGHQVRRFAPEAFYAAVDAWLERLGIVPGC